MEENTRPVTFAELPAKDFPFTIKFFKKGTDELLWEQEIKGPGVVEIPGFGARGITVRVELVTADGKVTKVGV